MRSKQFRVGRLSLSMTELVCTGVAGLVFAGTAGAFLPLATPASSVLWLIYSRQTLTLVLLSVWCWFVYQAIKNSPFRRAAPRVRWMAICMVGAYFGASFPPLLSGG